MRRPLTLVALLLAASTIPAGAIEPTSFRFHKAVERPAGQAEELLAVALDGDVHAATLAGWTDLRIFDDRDAEVTYLLDKAVETVARRVPHTCPSKTVSLKEAGAGIEIVVSLDPKAPPAEGIDFHTRLADYHRRVSVAGSKDGKEWTPLVTDAEIVDYTRYMDLRTTDVRLPANAFRQFRVSIADVTDEQASRFTELTRRLRGTEEQERIERTTVTRRPFRIERIELWREEKVTETRSERQADWPAVEFRVEEDAKQKATVLHVRTRREPLAALSLVTSSRNFSRAAVVEVPVVRGVQTDWVAVGHATVMRLDFRGLKREQLKVAFPLQRQAEYRLVIRNGDSPPLEITGVTGVGPVYRTVFLAQPDRTYRVCYGAEEAESPRYDTAAVAAALGARHRPADDALGPQAASAGVAASDELTLRRLLNNPIFLGVGIALMVVVLGWGLYRAGRRIEELPKQ